MTSLDGTEQSIEITITGTNDVPVISGDVSGSVVEDEALTAVEITCRWGQGEGTVPVRGS